MKPEHLDGQQAQFSIHLKQSEEIEFSVIASCILEGVQGVIAGTGTKAYEISSRLLQKTRGRECEIVTSNAHVNTLIDRAISDLRMLLTEGEGILYPYAGIPWFCTPFGRDGLITALQTLWFNADINRGVLQYLAAHPSHGKQCPAGLIIM